MVMFLEKREVQALTEQNGGLALWLCERISRSFSWIDDQSTIDGSSKPRTVRMPPKRTLLSFNGEPVGVTSSRLNGTLRYKFWSIGPSCSHLPYSMPRIGSRKIVFKQQLL